MKKYHVLSKEILTRGQRVKMKDIGFLPPDQQQGDALLIKTDQGYKVIPLKPDIKKIYVEVTSRCNFACTTCIRNSWRDEIGQMDWSTFQRLLEQLKELPDLECVHFGGFGEPMSHPRIFDMLKGVKALGVRVEMITNGSLLTQKNIDKLIDLPLDKIYVSLDGPDEEEYNEIRQGGEFVSVLDNIKALNKAKDVSNTKLPELGIEFVAMKKNFHKLTALICLSMELKARKVIVTNVLPYNEEMKDEILYDMEDALINYGKDTILVNVLATMPYMKLRTDRQCRFVEDKATTVNYRGEVAPCYALMHAYSCFVYGREKEMYPFYLGDVNKEKLVDIWNDSAYVNFRSMLKEFDYPSCPDCKYLEGCSMTESNEIDCWGNSPTCAECLWSRRLIACP